MENLIVLDDVALPSELLKATEKVVKAGKAKNINDLIARALRRELAAIRRAEIDAELAEMASDPEYQSEVLQLEAEFATAQWDALYSPRRKS